MSDLDQAEKEARNPPIFKKLFAGKSVEQEAMEVFAAKRKAQEQREELKQWISFTLGPSAWQDLIRTEVDIRKRRQETIYKQQEKKRKLLEAMAIVFLIAILAAFVLGVAWLYRANKANALSTYFPDRPNLEYSYYQSSYRQPF
jgi:cbb3-type cytochrome oxidase subunit 3